MTADELEDFEMDIGDALEGYDFDGTVGSAERILKEQKAYEAAMYRDYKAGRLDPKPGEPNRKRFLEKKLEEMELSGDKRLMTADEIEELSSFDLGTEMDEAIKKYKQKDIKQKRILEEFDPTDREKNASGGRVPLMYGGDPGFAFEYGGSWADWHEKHRDTMPVEQYIQTKLPKARLPFREMQSGGLAYMLGEPTYMKYGVGGSVGHAPWHKPTGQQAPPGQNETPTPNVASRPDPMKAPRGIPSLAPKNMDPAYMQKQMMQTAMMGQGNTGQGPRPMANEGGRIGYAAGGFNAARRAFLKMIAGITAGGVAAGTGLLKLGKAAKVAKPAAAVTETIIKSNAPGMPAWFPPLVKRVLKEGEDVSKAAGAMERQTVHRATLPSGTPVEVTSDLTKGDVIVDIGAGKHGWKDGWHGQPTRLVLKKGEWIEPTKKGKKGVKTKDEFDIEEAEFTGGHPENIKYEDVTIEQYGNHGSDFTEVEKYATGKTTKGSKAKRDVWEPDWDDSLPDYEDYASGGLAGLLGE